KEVDSRLIIKVFKCCDILVKMDRTENDLVFDYDKVNKNSASENDKNSEPINFDDTEGEEYEEVEDINHNLAFKIATWYSPQENTHVTEIR
ncbi:4252_t:CDS:2, partial [Cetraspora pellucida]